MKKSPRLAMPRKADSVRSVRQSGQQHGGVYVAPGQRGRRPWWSNRTVARPAAVVAGADLFADVQRQARGGAAFAAVVLAAKRGSVG
jgi:hypothetical protein